MLVSDCFRLDGFDLTDLVFDGIQGGGVGLPCEIRLKKSLKVNRMSKGDEPGEECDGGLY